MILKTPCAAGVCDKPVRSLGYCASHYYRFKRYGDPHVVKRRTYAQITYTGVHERLSNRLGPASEHDCAGCLGKARHWAYDHTDPKEVAQRVGRSKSLLVYSTDLSHYVPLCVRCHRFHDERYRARVR